MNLLFKVGTVTPIAVSAAFVLANGSCGSTSGEPPAEVSVENERLRSENESLALENERLSTTNQELQRELSNRRVEEAEQQGVALENVRLSGELARARIDEAEERARREQLEEALDEERLARIRLEALLDREQPSSDDRGGGFGWLEFIGLLVLAGAGLLWRERWWKSRISVLTMQRVPVGQQGQEAVTRRVEEKAPAKMGERLDD